VHCILERNFTFRKAGEKFTFISVVKFVVLRAGERYAQVVFWDSASLLAAVVAPCVCVENSTALWCFSGRVTSCRIQLSIVLCKDGLIQ